MKTLVEMNTKRCPRGTIRRNSYTRKSASGKESRVLSACIKDVGLPGKGFKGDGPGIGLLEEGELSKFGYEHVVHLSTNDRHTALTKAVKEYGSLTVFRKLNAVYVLTKYTSPATSILFLRDRNWVKRTFGIRQKE
jgi:hypothetical protein